MEALIGHSGFVSGNLLARRDYGALYRSSDIGSIRGRDFAHVVCAGVQAMANQRPAA